LRPDEANSHLRVLDADQDRSVYTVQVDKN
jgi:hypothetical protein